MTSPLLANIALHGMEEHIQQLFPHRYFTLDGKRQVTRPPKLVRFADDFIVLHEDLAVVQGCHQAISNWLNTLGLTLHPTKTRISHTLTPVEGNVGFDFLGYHFQQYPVGKHRSSHVTLGNPKGEQEIKSLGFKLFVTPSQESLKRHMAQIKAVIQQHSHSPQDALIRVLNPIIRGWATYFGYFNARPQLHKADFQTFLKLKAWATARCTGRGAVKIAEKYWHFQELGRWQFSTEDVVLNRHIQYRTTVYRPVKYDKSPFDGDWPYWAKRMGHYPGISVRVAKLLKRQNGKCAHCQLTFTSRDLIEVDHVLPRVAGGQDTYDNLQLLHGHCHDQKTATDGSLFSLLPCS